MGRAFAAEKRIDKGGVQSQGGSIRVQDQTRNKTKKKETHWRELALDRRRWIVSMSFEFKKAIRIKTIRTVRNERKKKDAMYLNMFVVVKIYTGKKSSKILKIQN